MQSSKHYYLATFLRITSYLGLSFGLLLIIHAKSTTGLLLLELPSQNQQKIYLIFAVAFGLFIISQIIFSFSRPSHNSNHPSAPLWRNLLSTIIASAIIISTSTQLIIIGKQIQKNLGQDIIAISGTGSMYPTFPKGKSTTQSAKESEIVAQIPMQHYPQGISIGSHKFFDYQLKRGDIVSFTNPNTFLLNLDSPSTGFVKRVIALPNDTLELRDGIVYLNGTPQKEPYVAHARSTFGGTTIQECQTYTVPPNQAIVMGDNRKGSLDSRSDLGFINLHDITHVIPYHQQQPYSQNWHDPQNDLSPQSKITLDVNQYLQLLNQLRQSHSKPPLKLNSQLTTSANLRSQKILEFNDFSPEATISGYPLKKSLQQANYTNNIWGETYIQGYYESSELIENQQLHPQTLDLITNSDFQDIGIAQLQGNLNNCPTQIIVIQFGGYKPPNYDAATLTSWQQALTNLEKIQPGWNQLKDNQDFYSNHQSDVNRINEIIDIRINRTKIIVNKIQQNQWLSSTEQDWITQDKTLSQEQSALAIQLNSR